MDTFWLYLDLAIERLFWVVIVIAGLWAASDMLYSAVTDWIDKPTIVTIDTFTLPATNVTYPAITICKDTTNFDSGDYVRAVFDNFQSTCNSDASCAEIDLLRSHFKDYLRLDKVRIDLFVYLLFSA